MTTTCSVQRMWFELLPRFFPIVYMHLSSSLCLSLKHHKGDNASHITTTFNHTCDVTFSRRADFPRVRFGILGSGGLSLVTPSVATTLHTYRCSRHYYYRLYRMSVARGCMTAVVVVAMVLVIAPPQPTQAFKLTDILGGFAGSLLKEAFKSQEVTLLDHYCQMVRSAYIKRLEVHYRAELSCAGWTTIKGKGSGRTNPTNAENDALKDFFTRMVAKGLVSREDASPWLDN